MLRLYFQITTLCVLSIFCVSCDTPNFKAYTKTNTKTNNVELDVLVPSTTKVGQPIEVIIRLINKGSKSVVWGRVNDIEELGISVMDSKDLPPPLTQFGQVFSPNGKDLIRPQFAPRYKYMLTPLNAGQANEWKVDLAKLFEFVPGLYTVSISMELDVPTYSFTVGVTPVKFRVK